MQQKANDKDVWYTNRVPTCTDKSFRILSLNKLENRKSPWRLRYSLHGETKTRHFPSEEEAMRWSNENGAKISPAEDISSEERLLIQLARLRCKSSGVDIKDTINSFIEFAAIPRTVPLRTAINEYIQSMESRRLRPSYVHNATYILEKFMHSKSDWPISSFTPENITNYCKISQKGESNRETVRNRLVTFFNFCKSRGYTSIDTNRIKWDKVKQDRDPISFWHPAALKAFGCEVNTASNLNGCVLKCSSIS